MRINVSLPALTAASTLVFALPVFAQASDWDAIVAAAQEEGEVVVYHSQLGARYFTDVVASFEEEYGIDVRLLDGRATEIIERVRSEAGSDRRIGDIVMPSTATAENFTEAGYLGSIGTLPNVANLRDGMEPHDTYLPAFRQAYGILVNTNMVAEDEMPTSWEDLLDPRWQGQILSNEVRTLGTGMAVLGPLWAHFGDSYVERLAGQDLTFSRDIRLEERRVAMGEFPILMTEMFAFYHELDGLPVTLVLPEEGSPYTPIDMALLDGAPHPNAARVFMNYFLSTEAQTVYAEVGMVPVVDGIIETLSEEFAATAGVRLIGYLGAADRAPTAEITERVFGPL
ncbi:ABC transporter substrate-binding protein [Pararhodobacter marinus]|uniref:ABC transporter substrate-binding protein n=1 Tax=Pararhodobacter marinus TaxID=2184063 RepID=UPI003515BF53